MSSLGKRLLPSSLHEQMQVERYPIHRFIRAEAIPLMKPGLKVLDAGSGRESEQHLRKELLATGATLHTCDFCAGPGVDFVASVDNLPFEDNSYDIVLCTQVLEHVQNPSKVCRELARVLKPGGHAFITAPQSSPLHNLPWNFFNYTNLGLRLLFEDSGLRVVKEVPQGGHFAMLAFNLSWTVREVRRWKVTPIIKMPVYLISRLLFGFLLKIPLIWLDRFDTNPLNTMGWNFHGQKDASITPAEVTGRIRAL